MCISYDFINVKSWEVKLWCCFMTYWQDGVHVAKKPKEEVEVTEEQKKVMRSQDINYVEMKRVAEAKVSVSPVVAHT